jgi:hypothetical protein
LPPALNESWKPALPPRSLIATGAVHVWFWSVDFENRMSGLPEALKRVSVR